MRCRLRVLGLALVLVMAVGVRAFGQAATGPAATGPATRATAGFWLERAVRDAVGIEDPALRAEAYSRAALLMARMGDVASYRRTIALAEEAEGRTIVKSRKWSVRDAVELATAPVLRTMARSGDAAGAKVLAEERAKGKEHYRSEHFAPH